MKHFVKTNLQNTVEFLWELRISVPNVFPNFCFIHMKFHTVFISLWVSGFMSQAEDGSLSLQIKNVPSLSLSHFPVNTSRVKLFWANSSAAVPPVWRWCSVVRGIRGQESLTKKQVHERTRIKPYSHQVEIDRFGTGFPKVTLFGLMLTHFDSSFILSTSEAVSKFPIRIWSKSMA